ncbi:MAG: hypothetical protein ACFFBP_15245 [Promethearchaeota archaeon]
MKLIVSLSYFHRKIGPINAYAYPESVLDDVLSVRIANIMDQTFNEGFFTHSFENLYSMNYYFEIPSDWARGNKEMLMASVIFDQQTSLEVEQKVSNLLADFASMLQANEEIYAAYYINDLNNYEEHSKEIIQNDKLMKVLIKDLYRTVQEDTREKSEEEVIASLLSENHIFLTLQKLSEGPSTLEGLSEWFHNSFVHKNFDDMIDILVDKQFIFKNKIGWTTYILLLREVSAERIPPVSVIENWDDENKLNEFLLPRILDFFNEHEKKNKKDLIDDSYLIFQVISDPKKYNILSKLRNGWIPKSKLGEIVPKRNLNSLIRTIEYLERYNFIDEIQLNGETCIVLKTNFQIMTDFPEYLRKLLKGKEAAPVIADKYTPSIEELEKIERQQLREEMAEIFKGLGEKVVQTPKETRVQSFLEELSSSPKKQQLKENKPIKNGFEDLEDNTKEKKKK